jgi:hypothetical protein
MPESLDATLRLSRAIKNPLHAGEGTKAGQRVERGAASFARQFDLSHQSIDIFNDGHAFA